MTHEDSPSLRKIIRSFGPISDEIQATLPALVGRFDAPDERVRLAALRAAHQLAAEGPCLVDPLGELARSKDKEVQLQALQLIADLGPGAGQLASQLLTLALSGRETESRAAAMRAFHAVGGGEALRRASKSDDRERFRAIRARRRGRSVD